MTVERESVDLSAARWAPGEQARYRAQQDVDRDGAGFAAGQHGAVTVAHGGYAARAGLEALKQGGTAIDAAMTTALAQIALTGGATTSYFGIMSLVYFEAGTSKVHTMDAGWNTLAGEQDPLSIPGRIGFGSDAERRGTAPSGRTAMVGGFLKGVEAAHRRFGTLPFASLFTPAIELAEQGFPIDRFLHRSYTPRADDLARLPATRAIFFKPDGSRYARGETWCQPALAATLRRIANEGSDYVYGGVWGEKLVAALAADGGRMTIEDLLAYEVIWADALIRPITDDYGVATAPWPNAGGVALIEAQNLATVAGLGTGAHWTTSADALRAALFTSTAINLLLYSPAVLAQVFPEIDFSPEARVTLAHACKLWPIIEDGSLLGQWKRSSPLHSDTVVVVDRAGNIAAVTHSINCIDWGRTAINVDGISIGDPGSFQQGLIAETGPGTRLPFPSENGILLKDGEAVLGFASMGAGLHARTLQGLLNVTRFGMGVEQAVNSAAFLPPARDAANGSVMVEVPAERFERSVLEETGYAWREVPRDEAQRVEGIWVAVARDPATGRIEAASHDRGNADAVAY